MVKGEERERVNVSVFYVTPECSRSVCSPVQLDDFEAYIKDMSKDSAYKFSLQFEVRQHFPFFSTVLFALLLCFSLLTTSKSLNRTDIKSAQEQVVVLLTQMFTWPRDHTPFFTPFHPSCRRGAGEETSL